MLLESSLGACTLLAGGWLAAHLRRVALYHRLTSSIDEIRHNHSLDLRSFDGRRGPGFADRLVRICEVLPRATFERVRDEASHLVQQERSFIPTHKKGGTVAYETLIQSAPMLVALYHSAELRNFVTRLVGVHVQPTPINDQSSLSVLFYDRPGDHIGWHYDHNFYHGLHFTVLLAVINEGHAAGGLSHATLMARLGGREVEIATPPNTLVVFEGAKVDHKVKPIREGERRLVVSMTFCSDNRAGIVRGGARRVKDVAFFGPRALWT